MTVRVKISFAEMKAKGLKLEPDEEVPCKDTMMGSVIQVGYRSPWMEEREQVGWIIDGLP